MKRTHLSHNLHYGTNMYVEMGVNFLLLLCWHMFMFVFVKEQERHVSASMSGFQVICLCHLPSSLCLSVCLLPSLWVMLHLQVI